MTDERARVTRNVKCCEKARRKAKKDGHKVISNDRGLTKYMGEKKKSSRIIWL